MRIPLRIYDRFLPAIVLVLLAASFALPSFSQSPPPQPWTEAIFSLAAEIASAVTPSRTMSIDVQDITAGAPVDPAAIRQALEAEIGTQGGRTVPISANPAADVAVRVTVSHDFAGYLLVAEIPLTDKPQAAIVPVSVAAQPPFRPSPEPTLHRRIVWEQSNPIVDFGQAINGGQTVWYILEPDRLVVHEFSGTDEVLEAARPISRLYTSRDPRGRIAITDPTHVTAWMAAARCDGAWTPSFSIDCTANVDEQWPTASASWTFDPSQNNFTGVLTLSSSLTVKLPAFYSAASPLSQTTGGSGSRWLVTGLEGRAQLFSGATGASASFDGWGSDIVSIAPACGSSWQLLVTGAGDWTKPDHIQLYEIDGEHAGALGQPLDVPGPILTMWPSDDGKSARVVSRNLQTGMYEASIVSPSCGD
jgi:hypothetical protein